MRKRKDYEALARAVRRNKYTVLEDSCNFIKELCDYLEKDNPRFNKEGFMKACFEDVSID
jgi:hypothetical protein